MVRGVSGLRPTAALLGVGSPLTMYPDGSSQKTHRATPATYADEWGKYDPAKEPA
ncbi:hypothetical protein ccbrp13_13860 [Ktedonobacteria bacterium brp13]|nr:hypothetical protein ccbrp13_13860 [Ktedonobacteria bacterium brp13]